MVNWYLIQNLSPMPIQIFPQKKQRDTINYSNNNCVVGISTETECFPLTEFSPFAWVENSNGGIFSFAHSTVLRCWHKSGNKKIYDAKRQPARQQRVESEWFHEEEERFVNGHRASVWITSSNRALHNFFFTKWKKSFIFLLFVDRSSELKLLATVSLFLKHPKQFFSLHSRNFWFFLLYF